MRPVLPALGRRWLVVLIGSCAIWFGVRAYADHSMQRTIDSFNAQLNAPVARVDQPKLAKAEPTVDERVDVTTTTNAPEVTGDEVGEVSANGRSARVVRATSGDDSGVTIAWEEHGVKYAVDVAAKPTLDDVTVTLEDAAAVFDAVRVGR